MTKRKYRKMLKQINGRNVNTFDDDALSLAGVTLTRRDRVSTRVVHVHLLSRFSPPSLPTPRSEMPDDEALRELAELEAGATAAAAIATALTQPLRRGFRTMVGQSWTGIVWEKPTGREVAECGHRHFVSADEAMRCPALDATCPPIAVESEMLDAVPGLLALLANAPALIASQAAEIGRLAEENCELRTVVNAHPLLVLWPRVGEWLHEKTQP